MVHLATLLMPDGPEDVATERIVHVFAEQQWKPETLKAYRNTIASFFRWLRKSGRRNDDPSLDVPRVKKPRAHPRPCPTAVYERQRRPSDLTFRPRGVPRAVLSWCEPASSRRCPSSSTRWRCRLSMRGLRAA